MGPGSTWRLPSNTSSWYVTSDSTPFQTKCIAVVPFYLLWYCDRKCEACAGRWERQWVRHDSWPAVHGCLLLSPQAVWWCPSLSQQVKLVFSNNINYFGILFPRSIKSYYYNDDVFNFDYGQAKAAVGNYQVWGFLRREQWSEVLYCWFHLVFLN